MNREDAYRPRPDPSERIKPSSPWEAAAWENAAMHRAMQSRGQWAEENASLIRQHMTGQDFTTAEACDLTGMDRDQVRRTLLRMKRNNFVRQVGEQQSAHGRREKIWRIV